MDADDPTNIIDNLDAEQLRKRLEAIRGHERALVALLRAANARDRSRRQAGEPVPEVRHAK